MIPPEEEIPTEISSNNKFSPFFDDCIGAIDVSCIAAVVKKKSSRHLEITRVFYLMMCWVW
jgi:hypothetical protein